MHFSLIGGYGHSVGCTLPVPELGDHLRIDVRDLQVIHVPTDSHLSATYGRVCITWIVWVQLESCIFQINFKLPVEQEGTPQEPIHSLLHLDVEDCHPLPVNCDIFAVNSLTAIGAHERPLLN